MPKTTPQDYPDHSVIYNQSKAILEAHRKTQELLDFWAFRYSVIVDNSHRKEDCPHAVGASLRSLDQQEDLEKLTSELADLYTHISNSVSNQNIKIREELELLKEQL